ncbi:MAG: hypothetical protein K6V73_08025 [Firmicutes bacterium]|nr:hypothetical protein [Bacillota bacterium]
MLFAVVSDDKRRKTRYQVTDLLHLPPELAAHDPPLANARPLARGPDDIVVFRVNMQGRSARRVATPAPYVPHLFVLRVEATVEGESVQGPYRTSDPGWQAFVAYQPERLKVPGTDRMFATLPAPPIDIVTRPVVADDLPMFGDSVPDIRVTAPGRLAQLVLGKERTQGEKRRRPLARQRFTPPWDDIGSRIWATVRRMGSGTYFLRAYGNDDDLLWSIGFRYAAGLEALDLEPYDPLPLATEGAGAAPYPPLCLLLRHQGCRVQARNAQARDPYPPTAPDGADRLAFSLPLEQDHLALELETRDGARMDIRLPIRRLRWRLVRGESPPFAQVPWSAHPLSLPEAAVRADSAWRLEIDWPWEDAQAPQLEDAQGRRLPIVPRRTADHLWSFPLHVLHGMWPPGSASRPSS